MSPSRATILSSSLTGSWHCHIVTLKWGKIENSSYSRSFVAFEGIGSQKMKRMSGWRWMKRTRRRSERGESSHSSDAAESIVVLAGEGEEGEVVVVLVVEVIVVL